ncbi:MAG TPA: serine/threonine-protein kinase [Kofleriaceae bacterium]|nr:serine/threonine-protein kinase [Kofleriaceae bacterium]
MSGLLTGDREETRAFVRTRLELFARVIFWTFALALGFLVGLARLYPVQRPQAAHVVFGAGLAGLAACALVWAIGLRRRDTSLATLYRIDGIYALAIGGCLGVTAYCYAERFAATYAALTVMVFSRTLVVPSSGPRTLVVATLSFAPLATAAGLVAVVTPHRLDLPAPPFLVGVALFSGLAVLLATTGSTVIYGLRRRVSEAMQLGPYTLEDKLGEGGMGVVHRARHAMLRRPTAIKLLLPDRHDAECLARFEREVQHMSRLTHPNTVAVFDYGRSPDGVLYYVMEYLDGIDLDTLVRRFGPQPPARVIHILAQVAGALEEAHAMGLVHRDVKPGNVILCRRGPTPDVAKLVDFGLVHDIAGPAGDAARGVVGTPAYISPEAVSDPARVGPRSDLYALGATGYFLVTGRHVFEGDSPLDVCIRHASAPPEPPSRRTAEPVPPALEAILMRCLAKRPDDRPPDARALRDALAALDGADGWCEADARAWWQRFDAARRAGAVEPDATVTIDPDAPGRAAA